MPILSHSHFCNCFRLGCWISFQVVFSWPLQSHTAIATMQRLFQVFWGFAILVPPRIVGHEATELFCTDTNQSKFAIVFLNSLDSSCVLRVVLFFLRAWHWFSLNKWQFLTTRSACFGLQMTMHKSELLMAHWLLFEVSRNRARNSRCGTEHCHRPSQNLTFNGLV